MNFKAGDWVQDTSSNRIFQVSTENFNMSGISDVYELWQPKEGEWCWFKTDKSFKLVKYNTPTFNQAYYHGLNPIVEPFRGTLPSFINEIK